MNFDGSVFSFFVWLWSVWFNNTIGVSKDKLTALLLTVIANDKRKIGA